MSVFTTGACGRNAFRKLFTAAALLLGMTLSPLAAADWYFGANTGPMRVDGASSHPTNAALVVGREWGVVLGDLGVQAELSTSTRDGTYAGQALSADSQAVYGVLRTAGPVYLIAKAGVRRTELTVGGASSSDSGSAYGIGVGFSLGVVRIELEHTRLASDTVYLSAGLRF